MNKMIEVSDSDFMNYLFESGELKLWGIVGSVKCKEGDINPSDYGVFSVNISQNNNFLGRGYYFGESDYKGERLYLSVSDCISSHIKDIKKLVSFDV